MKIKSPLILPIEVLGLKLLNMMEIEYKLLDRFVKKDSAAIDIGANIGVYTYKMSKLCKYVYAFEPQKELCEVIDSYAKYKKNIKVYDVALSDKQNNSFLNIPIRGKRRLITGLATFNYLDTPCKTIPVQVKRLDDYCFNNIGYIKIDVEGSEYDVINGSIETIKRNKPVIQVEIEERHLVQKSIHISDVFSKIINLGYDGVFYSNNSFKSLDKFSYDINQKPYLNNVRSKNYINNFIFIPVSGK